MSLYIHISLYIYTSPKHILFLEDITLLVTTGYTGTHKDEIRWNNLDFPFGLEPTEITFV